MAETVETLKTRLAEARSVRHKLMMGQSAVEVQDSNGERIRYTQASAGKLSAYISELESQIASLEKTSQPVRPARVWFSGR